MTSRGQTFIEYAILIAVVAAVLLSAGLYVRRGVQGQLKLVEEQVNVEAGRTGVQSGGAAGGTVSAAFLNALNGVPFGSGMMSSLLNGASSAALSQSVTANPGSAQMYQVVQATQTETVEQQCERLGGCFSLPINGVMQTVRIPSPSDIP